MSATSAPPSSATSSTTSFFWEKLLSAANNSHQELAFMLSNESERKLGDHCVALRNRVDQGREIALVRLHKSSEALLRQIDDYEKHCLNRSPDCKKLRDEIEHQLDTFSTFLNEQRTLVDSSQLNFDKSTVKIEKKIVEFAAYKNRLTNATFVKGALTFHDSTVEQQ